MSKLRLADHIHHDVEKVYQLFLRWIFSLPKEVTAYFLNEIVEEVNLFQKSIGRAEEAKNPLGDDDLDVEMDFPLGNWKKIDLFISAKNKSVKAFVAIELKIRNIESTNQTVGYFDALKEKFPDAIENGNYLCVLLSVPGLLPISGSFHSLDFLGLYGALADTIDQFSTMFPEAIFFLSCLHKHLEERLVVLEVDAKLDEKGDKEKLANFFQDEENLVQNKDHGIILAALNRVGRKLEQDIFSQKGIRYIGVGFWARGSERPLLMYQKRPEWVWGAMNIYLYIVPQFRRGFRIDLYIYDEISQKGNPSRKNLVARLESLMKPYSGRLHNKSGLIFHGRTGSGLFIDFLFFDDHPTVYREVLGELEKILTDDVVKAFSGV